MLAIFSTKIFDKRYAERLTMLWLGSISSVKEVFFNSWWFSSDNLCHVELSPGFKSDLRAVNIRVFFCNSTPCSFKYWQVVEMKKLGS